MNVKKSLGLWILAVAVAICAGVVSENSLNQNATKNVSELTEDNKNFANRSQENLTKEKPYIENNDIVNIGSITSDLKGKTITTNGIVSGMTEKMI